MGIQFAKLVLNYIKKHGDPFEHDIAAALLSDIAKMEKGPEPESPAPEPPAVEPSVEPPPPPAPETDQNPPPVSEPENTIQGE